MQIIAEERCSVKSSSIVQSNTSETNAKKWHLKMSGSLAAYECPSRVKRYA
jgi:hypothetical protein